VTITARSPAAELLHGLARLLLDDPRLVVVHGEGARALHHLQQLRAGEHRQPLPGIEHERAIPRRRGRALCSTIPCRPSGRTIASLVSGRVPDAVQVRKGHGARMEGGDLVVVDVGGDESLGRELVVELAHVVGRNPSSPRRER
jgi:hypothetical protein